MSRRRLRITGLVQGVGFRPFVVACAARAGVFGVVKNAGASVVVDVDGSDDAVAAFVAAVSVGPAAARVDAVVVSDSDVVASSFVVGASEDADAADTASDVPLDRAPCAACMADLDTDLDDARADARRRGHAFVSCTACGPRFTIVDALPWDRARTAMNGFAVCAACAAEYVDVDDRRCHSETQCCPRCGPRLATSIADIVAALRAGQIVAVKGVGGYHLCCDAGRDDVVQRLRQKKSRPDKPLAVMVRDLAMARALAVVDDLAAAALASPAAPIVVVPRAGGTLGLMLPSSPLHHLLLRAFDAPLVMTSGNRSEEPLVIDNDDASAVLGGIADVFLHHDRAIRQGVDDSVVRVIDGSARVWRRGRGLAPSTLPFARSTTASSSTILALGAHQRSSFAIATETRAILSPHVGDLDSPRAVQRLRESIARHLDLYGVDVDVVACDAHADYASSEIAESFGVPVERVQHHKAHAASLLAEHAHDGAAVVFAGDGSGLGDDGSVWGGEFFVGCASGFVRSAHLPIVRLPGGEKAARQPWRSAVAWLHESGIDDDDDLLPDIPRAERRLARQLIDKETHAPRTSSLGRLFDAVACLCGLPTGARGVVSFSGAAAIALEDAAADVDGDGAYDAADIAGTVAAVVKDVRAGVDVGVISGRFHNAVVQFIASTSSRLARVHDLTTVGLSGGVFMNARLLTGVTHTLRQQGFNVLSHHAVPTNDGGIALGQLAIAEARSGARLSAQRGGPAVDAQR